MKHIFHYKDGNGELFALILLNSAVRDSLQTGPASAHRIQAGKIGARSGHNTAHGLFIKATMN